MTTDSSDVLNTGLPTEQLNSKSITINIDENGGMGYTLSGKWSIFEIIGVVKTIETQVTSDATFVRKLAGLVNQENPSQNDSDIKQQLMNVISKL